MSATGNVTGNGCGSTTGPRNVWPTAEVMWEALCAATTPVVSVPGGMSGSSKRLVTKRPRPRCTSIHASQP